MKSFTAIDLISEQGNLKVTEETIAQNLVLALTKKGLKVATAESCTGGLVSQKITEVSGASLVFDCGVCSYSNNIKNKILSVEKEVLEKEGAVSENTAKQMAQGVRILANADIGISTTGIAGPNRDKTLKPIGLVYIGCSTKTETYAIKAEFCKDKVRNRAEIRELSANTALLLALKICKK